MKRIFCLLMFVLCATGCERLFITYIHPIYSAPACHENLLVIQEEDSGFLFAINKNSKNVEWKKGFDLGMIRSRPTIEGEKVYAWVGTDGQARVIAMNSRTRDILWKVPVYGTNFSPGVVTANEILFQTDHRECAIYALRKDTGKLLWKRPGCSMKLVHDGVILAMNSEPARIELLDSSSGDVLQELIFERYFRFSLDPRADCNENGIAVVGCNNLLAAVDIPARKLLWVEDDTSQRWMPAVRGDDLYLASRYVSNKPEQKYRLQHRALKDGSLIQETELKIEGWPYFPIQVFNDAVVISNLEAIAGYDRTTLNELWRIEDEDIWDVSSVNGKLFVGGGTYAKDKPFLWELNPMTGEKVWVFDKTKEEVCFEARLAEKR